MERLLRLLTLLVAVNTYAICYSQSRTAFIPVNENRVNWMYAHQQEMCAKLGIAQVIHSSCSEHFRLWTNNEVLDLCRKSDKNLTVSLTIWAMEYAPYNEEPTNRVFQYSILLDSIANEVDSLIQASNIKTIPDQSSIVEWKTGFDGVTYMIEHADDSAYYFKSYWTPSSQQTVNEAVVVQKFINHLRTLVGAAKYQEYFRSTVPFQCWQNDGNTTACRISTKKQFKQYKRERESYRKTKR